MDILFFAKSVVKIILYIPVCGTRENRKTGTELFLSDFLNDIKMFWIK